MSKLKHGVQQGIRQAHLAALRRPLPGRLPVYLHELEPAHWDDVRRMVEALRERGYRFVGLDEYLEPAATDRVAWLSFDDNFRQWWKALPLFEELDVPAMFYVNSGVLRDRASAAEIDAYYDRIRYTGDRTPLASAELVEMEQAGHRIGSHTATHPLLTAIPQEQAREEIRRGREILEEVLGRPVLDFAFPFGLRRHFSEPLRRYCAEIGMRTVTSARPIVHAPLEPMRLHRTLWRLDRPVGYNLDSLAVDGRWFEALTGRSALGD